MVCYKALVPYKNKEDQLASHRAWYKRNREAECLRVRTRRDSKRADIVAMIRAAKARPCMDCGVEYPPYVMDFDHVRGKKLVNVSASRRNVLSAERVEAEIAKCDLVCANCHRIRTHERKSGVV